MGYFYKSPVCKVLLITSITSTSLLYILHHTTVISSTSLLLRLLPKFSPIYPYSILLWIAIWKYRALERRCGTWQFVQFIFYASTVTLLITYVMRLVALKYSNYALISSFVYALLPMFISEMPFQNNLGSILISDHSALTTLLAYMCVSNLELQAANLISVAVSIVLWHYWPTLHNKFYLKLPERLRLITKKLFWWISDSAPPKEQVNGATLEIQRIQIMDREENRLRRLNNRRLMNPINVGANILNRFQGNHEADLADARRRIRHADSIPDTHQLQENVTPEKIDSLVDMGFERPNAMIALTHSGGDVDLAATILLAERN